MNQNAEHWLELLAELESSFITSSKAYKSDLASCRPESSICEVLHRNLSLPEQYVLLDLFYHREVGWFQKLDCIGRLLLSLSAIELGLTNANLKWLSQKQKAEFMLQLNDMPDIVSVLTRSVYLKQKLATWRILSQQALPTYTLYRGIRGTANQYYAPNCLESYTKNVEMAKRFAGANGWVLQRDIQIQEIFAYKTSLYRQDECPPEWLWTRISKEKEFIVENPAKQLEIEKKGDLYVVRNIVF